MSKALAGCAVRPVDMSFGKTGFVSFSHSEKKSEKLVDYFLNCFKRKLFSHFKKTFFKKARQDLSLMGILF